MHIFLTNLCFSAVVWYTLGVITIIYARVNFSRIKKTHGIELIKLQGGFVLLMLLSFMSLIFNVSLISASSALLHVYGYWPLPNSVCQAVALASHLGEEIHVACCFVAILCRNIVIYKQLGNVWCQRLYDLALKGNGFMVFVFASIWLFEIIKLRIPLIFLNSEIGFTRFGNRAEYCNIIIHTNNETSIDYNSYYGKQYYFNIAYFLFISFALITTIHASVCIKQKSLHPNGLDPIDRVDSVSKTFTVVIVIILMLAVTRHIVKFHSDSISPQDTQFFQNVAVLAYSVPFYIFVIFTSWPILKRAMFTMIKDMSCKKPREGGMEVDGWIFSESTTPPNIN